MNKISKGLLGLIFWLFVGFALTEVTALVLNAWLLNQPHPAPVDLMSAAKVELPHD